MLNLAWNYPGIHSDSLSFGRLIRWFSLHRVLHVWLSAVGLKYQILRDIFKLDIVENDMYHRIDQYDLHSEIHYLNEWLLQHIKLDKWDGKDSEKFKWFKDKYGKEDNPNQQFGFGSIDYRPQVGFRFDAS